MNHPKKERPQGFDAGKRRARGEFHCSRNCGKTFTTDRELRDHENAIDKLQCSAYRKIRRIQKKILSNPAERLNETILYEDDADDYDLSRDVVRKYYNRAPKKPFLEDELFQRYIADCAKFIFLKDGESDTSSEDLEYTFK